MILIENYPALKQILWDYHKLEISEKDAFLYYEERVSKWFDKHELSPEETALIDDLVNRYGAGVALF
ncbi:hypothetical protein [Pseudoalteromonas sp. S554]|mgnify:CR=1 FL=1|uniref:hypothetical protein n=1 Tax=Pseudoalteromonas sp. S554 TaxID=2066516 RepID=UPI00110CF080|nr:hypothetical protein [Pseudoalteromonas sp. S554]TMS80557.1 hypothetical protein CWB65_14660 [Pseudoalteromonas sp. S554]